MSLFFGQIALTLLWVFLTSCSVIYPDRSLREEEAQSGNLDSAAAEPPSAREKSREKPKVAFHTTDLLTSVDSKEIVSKHSTTCQRRVFGQFFFNLDTNTGLICTFKTPQSEKGIGENLYFADDNWVDRPSYSLNYGGLEYYWVGWMAVENTKYGGYEVATFYIGRVKPGGASSILLQAHIQSRNRRGNFEDSYGSLWPVASGSNWGEIMENTSDEPSLQSGKLRAYFDTREPRIIFTHDSGAELEVKLQLVKAPAY